MRMNPRSDSLYRFVVEGCNVRGQLVYLDESWRELAGRHDYPPVVRRLLGEAVSAAALLSATIKFDGALRIQASGDGGLRLLIAEATAGGTVRGLARWKGELESALLTELLGNGRLAITIDPGAGRESYQGIVELKGEGLSQSLRGYFSHSEQLPTRLWLAVGEKRIAGLLLQRVPDERQDFVWQAGADASRDAWLRTVNHADAMDPSELLDLGVADLLARINDNRPVRLYRGEDWRFLCSCSRNKVAEVLRALGRDDLESLILERERVSVNCEFCDAMFEFDAVDVAQLFVEDQHDLQPTRH
jgi:molecular chaperone Hsp33